MRRLGPVVDAEPLVSASIFDRALDLGPIMVAPLGPRPPHGFDILVRLSRPGGPSVWQLTPGVKSLTIERRGSGRRATAEAYPFFADMAITVHETALIDPYGVCLIRKPLRGGSQIMVAGDEMFVTNDVFVGVDLNEPSPR